jgi:hypothetical protein
MKFLYFLSALAIVNLIAVSAVAYFAPKPKLAYVSAGEIEFVSPTPIVVVKKIVKKVYVTATPISLTFQPSTQQVLSNATVAATQPSATSRPVASNLCTIVIDNVTYDVTNFRNSHSGGNVFNCGTDMSSVFWGRHNAAILSKMQQFRI